ncbi:hypothetical protein FC88_GL001762 [Companilactobacillus futsaii JCM 17355]|uniref:Uncharacterized protein n=1 Tax=Companilactobacillus futsaii JCM 17355 TaxID=1423818 RepID=A0ABR5P2T4_9LACO|nr:hypothetical protein FC88_GL001762 [Companilactobacillus futsaii JCM 17355]
MLEEISKGGKDMIQDINLQVYQMRKNDYTFAEIANSLGYSDEDIRNIDDIN